jgi:hypothetical protein
MIKYRLAASSLLLCLSSCVKDDTINLPQISWEGANLSFGDSARDPLCAGTLSRDDRFIAEFADFLGISFSADVRYFRLSDDDFMTTPCPEALGCYWDGDIYTNFVPNRHELVHAVLNTEGLASHPFLGEGLAELFSDSDNSPNEQPVEAGLSYTGPRDEFPDALRWRAGHFAGFLAARFSADQLKDLLSATCVGDDFEEMSAAFEKTLGMRLDALLQGYDKAPICSSRSYTRKLIECAEPEVECGGSSCLFESLMECDRPEVIGPRAGYIWSGKTLSIDAVGELSVVVSGGGVNAGALVGRCDTFCDAPPSIEVRSGDEGALSVSPGRYYLRPYASIDTSTVSDPVIMNLTIR